jgi:hypothetical protein
VKTRLDCKGVYTVENLMLAGTSLEIWTGGSTKQINVKTLQVMPVVLVPRFLKE